MPILNVIASSTLNGSKPYGESTTSVFKATLPDGTPVYYKKPDANFSTEAKNVRIISELFAAWVASRINGAQGSLACIPDYSLVLDNGVPCGIASAEIAFDAWDNHGNAWQYALDKGGCGMLCMIRWLLEDPDGNTANTGFIKEKSQEELGKVASIDFGLSFYLILKQHKALSQLEGNEKEGLCDADFTITLEALASALCMPEKNAKDCLPYLMTHFLGTPFLKGIGASDEALSRFFNEMYTTCLAFIDLMRDPEALKNAFIQDYQLESLLTPECQTVLNTLCSYLSARTEALKVIFADTTLDQFKDKVEEFRQVLSAQNQGRTPKNRDLPVNLLCTAFSAAQGRFSPQNQVDRLEGFYRLRSTDSIGLIDYPPEGQNRSQTVSVSVTSSDDYTLSPSGSSASPNSGDFSVYNLDRRLSTSSVGIFRTLSVSDQETKQEDSTRFTPVGSPDGLSVHQDFST